MLGFRLEKMADHLGPTMSALFCAGIGVGAFQGWDGIEPCIPAAVVNMPNRENQVRYEELLRLHREIYEAVKDEFPHIVPVSGRAS